MQFSRGGECNFNNRAVWNIKTAVDKSVRLQRCLRDVATEFSFEFRGRFPVYAKSTFLPSPPDQRSPNYFHSRARGLRLILLLLDCTQLLHGPLSPVDVVNDAARQPYRYLRLRLRSNSAQVSKQVCCLNFRTLVVAGAFTSQA